MKREITIIHALLLVFIAGCAAEPTQRLADADRAVITASDTLTAAIDGQLLTDPVVITAAKAAVNEANAVLAKAHASTQPTDRKFWTDQAFDAIPRITAYIAKMKAEQGN